jgi:hypothetical protein
LWRWLGEWWWLCGCNWGEVVVGVAENEGCRERVRVMEQHGLEK